MRLGPQEQAVKGPANLAPLGFGLGLSYEVVRRQRCADLHRPRRRGQVLPVLVAEPEGVAEADRITHGATDVEESDLVGVGAWLRERQDAVEGRRVDRALAEGGCVRASSASWR